MGKFVMPPMKYFLGKKRIFNKKKDPVWVYLEREMRENAAKKPYNYKVGAWLKFLKDLRYYFYCEAKRKYERLWREVGPPWYMELSPLQRVALTTLKDSIHRDILSRHPIRINKDLRKLGISIQFEKEMLMQCMHDSVEDPGVFLWYLYERYYKVSPSELRLFYDQNAMILMSSLVVLDLDECISLMDKLTEVPPKVPQPPQSHAHKKNWEPKVKYGMYLQKLYAKYSDPAMLAPRRGSIDYTVTIRSAELQEKLFRDTSFLDKRKLRSSLDFKIFRPRVCNYKFWVPPPGLKNLTPKERAYALKLRMYMLVARPRHLKFKAVTELEQYHLGSVCYVGNKPRYLIQNMALIPAQDTWPINGGQVWMRTEYITNVLGHRMRIQSAEDRCDKKCTCHTKWGDTILKYVYDSKCKCGHHYDYYNEGSPKELVYHKPTRGRAGWLDMAKLYQLDPLEEFIKSEIREALRSDSSIVPPYKVLNAKGLKIREVLEAFLIDLAETTLIIPHLPKAHKLKILHEWVRERVQGKLPADRKNKLRLIAQRRWLELDHFDFKARSYNIPFTDKQLAHFNWNHRHMMQKMFQTLVNNFVMRNGRKQVNQSRMFWGTMHSHVYPDPRFLKLFFTYMPATYRDILIVNPYNSSVCQHRPSSSCPLNLPPAGIMG